MSIDANKGLDSGVGSGGGLPSASSAPSGYLFKTDATQETTTISVTDTPYQINVTAELKDSDSSLFEEHTLGGLKYIGTSPTRFLASSNCTIEPVSGAEIYYLQHAKNGTVINSGVGNEVFVDGSVRPFQQAAPHQSIVTMLTGDRVFTDVSATAGTVNVNTTSYDLALTPISTLSESDVLGAELFANPDITDTTGFTGNSATVTASGGELTAEATAGAATLEAAVSGLTIGERYRIAISAKRGSQGTSQYITSTNFGTISSAPILLTSYVDFYFDVVATGTSGAITMTVSGSSGDELLINSFSVKEYL